MDLAVRRRQAFATWRLVPAPKRAEILMRAGQLLQQRKEQYARDMTREMGKVLAETRGDVQEAIDEAFYVAGEGRRLFGVTAPSELQNKFAMSVRMPVGVVGMITPWNFPMAIPSWKLFPALVSGNTCVIKPAEDTPLSTYNLVQALVDAGLPPGVVNIVCGLGPDAGAPLVEHKDVRAISFTGSSEVGRWWRSGCRSFQARIARDGRQECADCDGRREPGTGAGRCAVGRVRHHRATVHGHQPHPAAEGNRRQVYPQVCGSGPRRWVGDGLDDSGGGTAGECRARLRLRRDTSDRAGEGARLLDRRHSAGRRELWGRDLSLSRRCWAGSTPGMRIAREEVFGPVVSLMECDSFEQAIEIANSIDYGLSTALYTKECESCVYGDAGFGGGNYVYQRSDDWGGGTFAVWRSEANRERASRGVRGRSTFIRRGRRCMWITRISCSGRRSIWESEKREKAEAELCHST